MLKRPETIVCGDIGLVLLSGLGTRRTHPVGAEGATMARRAPFPLSSIPAYIEQSMKLYVCLSVWTEDRSGHGMVSPRAETSESRRRGLRISHRG